MADNAPALGGVAENYAVRAAAFAREEAGLRREVERLSQLRLLAFVIGAGSGIALLGDWGNRALTVVGLILGAAAYVVR